MQSLEEMRKELDVIDDQITTLYERRMKVCEGVAEYKIKNGRKVFDKTRENEKLAAVAEKVSTDFNKKGIRELFEQLMSMSRKLQYQRLSEEGVLGRLPFIGLDQLDLDGARVVFQGVEGANNQAAMLKYFGKNVKNFHVSSFRDAMEAIEEFEHDDYIKGVLGPHITEKYAEAKKAEWADYRAQVTQWEIDEYLYKI